MVSRRETESGGDKRIRGLSRRRGGNEVSNYAGSRSSMDGSTEFTLDLEGHAGLQRSAEVGAPNYVNIITAVAYHFCPS